MGESWRIIALILTVAGLVIPVAAVLVALRRVRAQVDDLASKYARVKALYSPEPATVAEREDRDRRAQLILASTGDFLDVAYIHETIQIHLRTAEWNQLRWPALWAGFGLVCSTAGSIIGLYLPAG